jgi:hypothetical protein
MEHKPTNADLFNAIADRKGKAIPVTERGGP